MSDEKTSEDKASDRPAEGDTEVEEKAASKPSKASLASSKDDADAPDSASPEAVARRVAALGEDDAYEKAAREEERKLAERRAGEKKKKKKGGLEVAASKKLSKIGTRAEPKRSVAVAADADPLLEKTTKLSEWAKENQKVVQIVGGLVAAALLGVAGYMYFDAKRDNDASVLLSQAVADERAGIGEPPKPDPEHPAPNPGPMFKTFEARRESALAKYKEVQERFPKTGAAILARLAEGSLLLDQRDPDGAVRAYEDVKGSALAAADREVRGRALEGLGFAYELKAQLTPAESAKFLDQAIEVYRELENTVEVRGFKELAMYHQARAFDLKGDKEKAKELLVALKERFAKPDDGPNDIPFGPTFPYLREMSIERLREIDPSAAPRAPAGPFGRGRGGAQPSAEEIRKLIEEAQQRGGH